MIDASEGVTEQDAKIAGIAHEKGKGMIIAVNKWDAIEKNDKTIYKHTNKIREVLSFMPYAEIIFISAKTGSVELPEFLRLMDAVIENQTHAYARQACSNEIIDRGRCHAAAAVRQGQAPEDLLHRLRWQ